MAPRLGPQELTCKNQQESMDVDDSRTRPIPCEIDCPRSASLSEMLIRFSEILRLVARRLADDVDTGTAHKRNDAVVVRFAAKHPYKESLRIV